MRSDPFSISRKVQWRRYLVVRDHTREARSMLAPDVPIAPEQTVVVETNPDTARDIGRTFVSDPYLQLVNYANNFRRYGYTDIDREGGGSDRPIDALVLHGSADSVSAGLHAQFEAGGDHIGTQVLTVNIDVLHGGLPFRSDLSERCAALRGCGVAL